MAWSTPLQAVQRFKKNLGKPKRPKDPKIVSRCENRIILVYFCDSQFGLRAFVCRPWKKTRSEIWLVQNVFVLFRYRCKGTNQRTASGYDHPAATWSSARIIFAVWPTNSSRQATEVHVAVDEHLVAADRFLERTHRRLCLCVCLRSWFFMSCLVSAVVVIIFPGSEDDDEL